MTTWQDEFEDYRITLYSDVDPTHEHPKCGVRLDIDTFRKHAPHYCPSCGKVSMFRRLE